MKTETPVDTEFRLHHAPRDQWRWTQVRAVPLRSDREQARQAGFDHHLLKPAQVEAIQALLRGKAPD